MLPLWRQARDNIIVSRPTLRNVFKQYVDPITVSGERIMAVVSYRLYCHGCDEETVIRDSKLDETAWKIMNLQYHEGECPRCNDSVQLEEVEWEPEPREISLESLDNIGAKAAENLREAGYDSDKALVEASDEELLDVSWVGQKALFSLKEATKQLEPQERWDE